MNVSLHCICGILLYCIVVASLFSFICGVLFVVQVVRGCLVPVIACGCHPKVLLGRLQQQVSDNHPSQLDIALCTFIGQGGFRYNTIRHGYEG